MKWMGNGRNGTKMDENDKNEDVFNNNSTNCERMVMLWLRITCFQRIEGTLCSLFDILYHKDAGVMKKTNFDENMIHSDEA